MFLHKREFNLKRIFKMHKNNNKKQPKSNLVISKTTPRNKQPRSLHKKIKPKTLQ